MTTEGMRNSQRWFTRHMHRIVYINMCPFFSLLLIEQLKMRQETGWERGAATRSKGPQAGTRTRDRCSEDKASVHGMPALPTEVNGVPNMCLLILFCRFMNLWVKSRIVKVSSQFFMIVVNHYATLTRQSDQYHNTISLDKIVFVPICAVNLSVHRSRSTLIYW